MGVSCCRTGWHWWPLLQHEAVGNWGKSAYWRDYPELQIRVDFKTIIMSFSLKTAVTHFFISTSADVYLFRRCRAFNRKIFGFSIGFSEGKKWATRRDGSLLTHMSTSTVPERMIMSPGRSLDTHLGGVLWQAYPGFDAFGWTWWGRQPLQQLLRAVFKKNAGKLDSASPLWNRTESWLPYHDPQWPLIVLQYTSSMRFLTEYWNTKPQQNDVDQPKIDRRIAKNWSGD